MENENAKAGKPETPPTTAAPSAAVVAKAKPVLQRTNNFVALYANHIQIESNAFDLKMVFGLLDQSAVVKDPSAPATVDQHSSMNISWPEVKLLIFWLQVHLWGHEKENGKVKLQQDALPPEVPPIPQQFDNPKGREAFEMIRKMRAEFIAKQNES